MFTGLLASCVFAFVSAPFPCMCRGKKKRKTPRVHLKADTRVPAFLYAARREAEFHYVSASKARRARKLLSDHDGRCTAVHSFKDSPQIKYLLWCFHMEKRVRRWKQRTEEDKGGNRSRSFVDARGVAVDSDAYDQKSSLHGCKFLFAPVCVHVCECFASPCLLRLLIFLKQVPSHSLLSLCCLISSMISGCIFSLSSLPKNKRTPVL